MRTTLTIDDNVLQEAKEIAARFHRTLSAVVEDMMRESIYRRRAAKKVPPPLPSFRGGGVLPGVDLNDSAGLLDLMEDPDVFH